MRQSSDIVDTLQTALLGEILSDPWKSKSCFRQKQTEGPTICKWYLLMNHLFVLDMEQGRSAHLRVTSVKFTRHNVKLANRFTKLKMKTILNICYLDLSYSALWLVSPCFGGVSLWRVDIFCFGRPERRTLDSCLVVLKPSTGLSVLPREKWPPFGLQMVKRHLLWYNGHEPWSLVLSFLVFLYSAQMPDLEAIMLALGDLVLH